jgi:hypothetical protein
MRREDERGGSPVDRPAGESSYGACGAPSCTMAWIATVRTLEAEVERLREALRQIEDVTTNEPDAIEAATRASHIAHDAFKHA